jgi:hypothetical protein
MFFIGAKIAERAPAMIFILCYPSFCQTSYFSPSEMLLCQMATSSVPKRLAILIASCEARAISGARKIIFLPFLMTSSIALK